MMGKFKASLSSRMHGFCEDIQKISEGKTGQQYEPTILHLKFDAKLQSRLTIELIVNADPRDLKIAQGIYGREDLTFSIRSRMSPVGLSKLLSELNTFATLIGTDDLSHHVSIRLDGEMRD